jgi:hypothetical protein
MLMSSLAIKSIILSVIKLKVMVPRREKGRDGRKGREDNGEIGKVKFKPLVVLPTRVLSVWNVIDCSAEE